MQSLDLKSKNKTEDEEAFRRRSFWRKSLVERELFVVSLLVFGASMSTIISSQDAIHFALTWSLATTHHIWLDGQVYGGALYTVKFAGHTFSALPPGLAYFTFLVVSLAQMITPLDPSASGQYIATYFSSIFAAIATVIFFKIAKMFGREKTAAVLAVIFAFGTGLWLYSRIYLPEALASCLTLIAVYCVLRAREICLVNESKGIERDPWSKRSNLAVPSLTLAAGISLGLAVFVDNLTIFFALPLLAFLAIAVWPPSAASKVGSLFTFVLGLVIGFIPTLGYDLASTGNVFLAPYGIPFIGGLDPSGYTLSHFGQGLYELLLSPQSGLVFFTPFVLVSLVGLFYFTTQKPVESIFFVGLSASILVPMALAANSAYFLHNTIGPSDLVLAVPYMLLPAMSILSRLRKFAWPSVPVYVLAIASILMTGIIALTDPVPGPAVTLSQVNGANPLLGINIPLFLDHSFLTWWSFFSNSIGYATLILIFPAVILLSYWTSPEFKIRHRERGGNLSTKRRLKVGVPVIRIQRFFLSLRHSFKTQDAESS